MANDDKYPVESDRRRFVKGVVGGSVLSGVLATGAVTVSSATNPTGGGGGIMNYFGANRTLGPAPRGLPQIPMEINDDGELLGVWPEPESETLADGSEYVRSASEIGGVEYTTEWYQYCGLQTFDGVVPDADGEDALFRYDAGGYDWMEDVNQGETMLTEHFEDYDEFDTAIGDPGQGKPATGTWRSQEVPPEQTVPILVIKTDQLDLDGMDERTRNWIEASCPEDDDGGRYIAYVNKCTHFCCVPGYRNLGGAPDFGADNKIYCNCHNSVYEPFNPTEDQFVSLPRPEGN